MGAVKHSATHRGTQAATAESPSRGTERRKALRAPIDIRPGAVALQRLQILADGSSPVRRLAGMQQLERNRCPDPATAQREVDTTSSPSLPEYSEDEQPAWQDNGGVPNWAQEEYRAEAPRTLICSVADGKIGSVYFGSGRIRTTHSHGPAAEQHAGLLTLKFNVNSNEAQKAFERQYPTAKKFDEETYYEYFDIWLSLTLRDTPVDHLPQWAVKIEGPDDAFDPATGDPPDGIQLWEVFTSINGRLEGWHPSRGIAARFATDKQVVSVLRAAIRHLKDEGIKRPDDRNRAFYDFIEKRVPDFVSNIRRPEEV